MGCLLLQKEMWRIERTVGEEKIYRCSECGYQVITHDPPGECPNCGEVSLNEPRSISLDRSSIDIDDEEVGVYEYERDVPAYKLWYFWVVLVLTIALVGSGLMLFRAKVNTEPTDNTDKAEKITFTPPTGWTKNSETSFTGPGEGAEIKIAIHDVSVLDNVDEFGKLVAELTDIEDVTPKEVNGIDGRYISWKTRKIVDGEEVYTDFARYVFIYKGKLYVIMYKSQDGNPEVFDVFLNTLSK